MKRKAACRPASGQPANKMSSSKGKQVAGTPVDADQEAHGVLRATAPSQKVCMRISCSYGMAAPRQLHCNCLCGIGMSFCGANSLVCPHLHLPSHLYHLVCLAGCMRRQ